MQRWSYHQIYLFVHQNQIYWAFGHGDTSQSRSNHNHLLEIFLKYKEARKKVITAIIAVNNGSIISYYFYNGFAYSNNDIGSNWNREIVENLKKSKLPYSEVYNNINSPTKSLFFINRKIKIEIYRQTKEDISSRKFNLYLERLAKKNKLKE